MKEFKKDQFFYAVKKLKTDQKCYEILPSLRLIVTMAIWEGLADEKTLKEFDSIIA